MKAARKALKIWYVIFGILLIAVIVLGIISAVSAKRDIERAVQEDTQMIAPVKVDTKPKTTKEPQQSVENEPSEPTSRTSSPATVKNEAAAPRPATGGEAPKKQQQPERIPFTQKEVTPGDPESYLGTYGQCPFYENAMEGKGCVPPPDIECNADWSECHLKES